MASRGPRGGERADASAPRAREDRVAQFAFLAVILAYLVVLAVQLPGLSHGARFFPAIIIAVSAVFVALKAASLASPRAARYLEPDVSWFASSASAPPAAPAAPSAASARVPGVIASWLWVTGAVLSMYAFGFLVGTAVSVLVYTRFIGGDGWRASVIAAGATVLFAWLVFVRAMHIPLDFGFVGGLF